MVPSNANFCRSCGDSLPPDAAYCPGCGTAIYDGWERHSSKERTRTARTANTTDRQFRRHVEDYLVEGWTVEREFDDRVVLVNRGFGSLVAHIALVLFTSGVGNVVYAWYCYGPGAPRRELRADGVSRSLDDRRGRVGGIDLPTVGGLVVGFLGLSLAATLFALGEASLLVALLLLTTFVLLGVTARSRSDHTESLTTFGRKRTLSEQSLGDVPEACADCGDVILDGVERTFAERTYVAGVPVRTHETGTNRYCGDCANDDGGFRVAAYDRERERELA